MFSINTINSVVLRGSLFQKSNVTNVARSGKIHVRAKSQASVRAKSQASKPVCSSNLNDVMPTKNISQTAEKLNGRLAMLGFLSGSGFEYVTGMNYIDQVQTTWPYLVVMVGVVSFATLKTRNLEVVEEAPFTTNLELLNGRMAMMGLLCKFIYDSHLLF
jgi:hypothetical protein